MKNYLLFLILCVYMCVSHIQAQTKETILEGTSEPFSI